MKPSPARWIFETRILFGALLVALPAFVAVVFLLWRDKIALVDALLALTSVVLITLAIAAEFRRRMVYPLRTLSNLLEALREGDYSLRGSRAQRGDAIGDVIIEVNSLSRMLREQRLAVEEKSALFAKVIAALDIAVLAFDDDGALRLANPAAERLLGARFERLQGKSANALELDDWLALSDTRIRERSFPGGGGRWEVRHARFRENGRPHDLLVVTDLSRALRQEERLAWQRLLRVLGHELNNSLAPIRSMAATLAKLLASEPMADDWRSDYRSGLDVIGDRAEALARFMGRYTTFAKLPPPNPQQIAFGDLARRVIRLEQRLSIAMESDSDPMIDADPDQIEQALINLVKNAVDAALATSGGVRMRWQIDAAWLAIEIIDDGAGLPPTENLFVPFFTTKPGGSGIGLVLARQIIEAHAGSLTLDQRSDSHGCIARIQLPLRNAQ
ncbi:MAG: ATP-binding protein [Dokdonella sp.]